nr:hypothetical protein CFP56_38657 [Quercus suber]
MGQVTGELQVGESELANLVRNDVDDTRLMENCAETVGESELANLVRNDVDDTRLMENCAETVKAMSVLGKDFEKKLAKIVIGIHGEVF